MVPLQAPLVHGGPWMQQGWPVLPHGVQWSAEPVVLQMVVVPVQTFPAQQGSPSVPHDSQKPEDPDETHTLLPAPSEEHDASLATHVLVLAAVDADLRRRIAATALARGSPGAAVCAGVAAVRVAGVERGVAARGR